MDNLPFHPLIVHFPLALAILVPLVALGCLVLSWRHAGRGRLWLFVSVVSSSRRQSKPTKSEPSLSSGPPQRPWVSPSPCPRCLAGGVGAGPWDWPWSSPPYSPRD